MFSCSTFIYSASHGQPSEAKSSTCTHIYKCGNLALWPISSSRIQATECENHKGICGYFRLFGHQSDLHWDNVWFDLSTEAFLHVFKRFVGRRGTPSHIFSDNATNFVGANRELKERRNMLIKEEHPMIHDSAIQGIQWHFIPPRAPNFGGIWEAAVRSFKSHLKRVVGNALLTTEEMQTLSIQIEVVLNSPLPYLVILMTYPIYLPGILLLETQSLTYPSLQY